ncbi:MAG: hypothetical protein ACJATI_004186 [Halioglobus sp.]|jgi:hypothetical protein
MIINFTKLIFVTLSFIGLSNSSIAQEWSKSFSPGNFDSNSKFLGGSEVLQLIGHKDKLFASVGYWEDENNIWYGGTNFGIGWGQIIRLDHSTGQWQEDFFLGASYLRPEVLKQVIFTKDATGNLLSTPDTILIAAGYSPNFITNKVTVKSFARNDNSGDWGESQIIQGSFPPDENYSIRDIEVYTDQVTGIERVYASVGTQGLFAGKYNQSNIGKIDWIPTPEIGPLSIRPLGITNANNTLYFSSGNKLYRRNDGAAPTYTIAHDFSDLSTNINSAVGGVRGLTTIKNPNGNDEALLLMWCPNGQSQGIIYRLEPDGAGGFNRIYETKLSILVEDYLLGINVNYLLGAYNEFYEFVDPITNDTVHLIGFEANITGGGHPTWNSYYSGGLFAKRDANMQYAIEEINGSIEANDTALVATRCYVKSPFENEDAIYFGGFDPNSKTATNMAWIYNKRYQTTSANEQFQDEIDIIVYPNPATNRLNVKVKTNKVIKYEIISVLGETILSGFIGLGNHGIDISQLASNIYFIRIEDQIIKFMKIK